MEVPAPGLSKIQLSGISAEENAQFENVVAQLEAYSQQIVKSFDSTTSKIRTRLDDMGDISSKALQKLREARDNIDTLTDQSVAELDAIMDGVDAIVAEMDCLDGIQAEILRLSDVLTTVEASIRPTSAQ